jgi:gas vesicle structural protein
MWRTLWTEWAPPLNDPVEHAAGGHDQATIGARTVIASVDTYLRFAEAVNRLDLTETQTHGIPELMEDLSQAGSRGKTSGAIGAVRETLGELFDRDEEDEDEDRRRPQPARKGTSNRPRKT